MIRQLGSLLALLGLAVGVMLLTHQDSVARAPQAKQQDQVLRHVVLFKFQESATDEDIRQIEAAFAALPGKIDSIVDLEKGFTHCFLVTFADEAGRAQYLPHPAHQEFVKLLKPHLEDVTVVDYWAKP